MQVCNSPENSGILLKKQIKQKREGDISKKSRSQ